MSLSTRLNLQHAAALVALCSLLPAAHAAPTWAQYDELAGSLDNNYTVQANGTSVVVSFTAQTITNVGSQTGHYGMYFGWSWIRPGRPQAGGYQAMDWSTVDQAFKVGNLTMQVQRDDGPTGSLRPADVLGDTWIGVPWTPDSAIYPAVATQAGWDLPLFDLGVLAPGQSTQYAVTFRFDGFATASDAQIFRDFGGFASYSQGVVDQQVPEPLSAALALQALALAAWLTPAGRRLRRQDA